MIEEFMKDIQKVCREHEAGIYPGYIDEAEEEEGIIIHIDDAFYSLKAVSKSGFSFDSLK